ncbi:hypothetical protein KIPB_016940, partial [Kipferlia bialata]
EAARLARESDESEKAALKALQAQKATLMEAQTSRARIWRPVTATSLASIYAQKEDFGQHILKKTGMLDTLLDNDDQEKKRSSN